MMLVYPTLTEECLYIDNDSDQSYIVSLRSLDDWLRFRDAVDSGSVNGVSISYGCKTIMIADPCSGDTKVLLDGRDQQIRKLTFGEGREVTFLCDAGGPNCGRWTKTTDSSPCGKPLVSPGDNEPTVIHDDADEAGPFSN